MCPFWKKKEPRHDWFPYQVVYQLSDGRILQTAQFRETLEEAKQDLLDVIENYGNDLEEAVVTELTGIGLNSQAIEETRYPEELRRERERYLREDCVLVKTLFGPTYFPKKLVSKGAKIIKEK